MKIEKISGNEERRIVTAMVVDPVVLGRIASKWTGKMFRSKWSNIVGAMCVDYHNRFGDAPATAMEGLFEVWARKHADKDTVGLVERFLMSLSSEYETLKKRSNSSYLIDLAGRHFNQVAARRLAQDIEAHLDKGDATRAVQLVQEFTSVEVGAGSHIDVYHDKQAILKALTAKKEPLLTFKGSFGRFFGDSLAREGFISFLAPEKVGKTWWLCELSYRAMRLRRRVAFFSIGDESEDEMMIRLHMRNARLPVRAQTLRVPISIKRQKKSYDVSVAHDERRFRELSYQQIAKACKRTETIMHSDKEYLRLSVHPGGSVTMKAIDAQLKQWEREGWSPDVVVIDYMDLLQENGSGRDEMRHRISATWREARGLAQRWRVLLLTATQANASSYEDGEKFVLTRKHFSESKTKLAHVTGMVGINQTDTEKDDGIMRLNWVVRRGAAFRSGRCCFVAGQLSIGCPVLVSSY